MFDPLLEEDPWVQEKVAQGELREEARGKAKGKAEGRAEGELKASRDIFINIVRCRFPRLAEIAEVKAAQIEQADALSVLIERITRAADEAAARTVMEEFAAS